MKTSIFAIVVLWACATLAGSHWAANSGHIISVGGHIATIDLAVAGTLSPDATGSYYRGADIEFHGGQYAPAWYRVDGSYSLTFHYAEASYILSGLWMNGIEGLVLGSYSVCTPDGQTGTATVGVAP